MQIFHGLRALLVSSAAIAACGFSSQGMAADSWVGYVCKVMDYFECQSGTKMIFPRPERYSDRDTCYEEFGKLFAEDTELLRRFPQTDNAHESYLFGCVQR